jgi:hypothetical protein
MSTNTTRAVLDRYMRKIAHAKIVQLLRRASIRQSKHSVPVCLEFEPLLAGDLEMPFMFNCSRSSAFSCSRSSILSWCRKSCKPKSYKNMVKKPYPNFEAEASSGNTGSNMQYEGSAITVRRISFWVRSFSTCKNTKKP